MKKFVEIMAKEILSENFTKKEYVMYGVIVPVAFVAIMCLTGWIETL